MEITKTFHPTDRKAWREWLERHARSEKEIWLITYKKATGRARISYNDAVEEALCFGWIDSTVKRLDEQRTAQRFTPRRRGSAYSQANKERLRRMIERDLVVPEVRAGLDDLESEEFEIPPDILKALQANTRAWENFKKYSAAYQRIRIAYIDHARDRSEEFEKRLRHFLKMTEKDKQFGYWIETYY